MHQTPAIPSAPMSSPGPTGVDLSAASADTARAASATPRHAGASALGASALGASTLGVPLAARADALVAELPHAAMTLAAARQVLFAAAGPAAGAVVGVYGSGKSTLLFALLREAVEAGVAVVWEEAAALVARLLPESEPVLPQAFATRVLAWVEAVGREGAERAGYLQGLAARGRDDVVAVLAAAGPGQGTRTILLLDEVEQAHHLLQRRVASDDGQPLRALIDACGPRLRLLLAYAPESFHSLGDADRGRLVRLGLAALDVATIQATWRLDRGAANFAWWASRGRARGVIQVVGAVLAPARAGGFDADLHALGDAVDALPGVFGVPALLREGLDHAQLRALLDLRPAPVDAEARCSGVVCRLDDRRAMADLARRELARRLGPHDGLGAIANELVAVLEACAGDDARCYLTLADFGAALRLAEARAIEAGRLVEPLPDLVENGARIFECLGTVGPLTHRLPLPLRELAEERFPSPFTDPYLPMHDGTSPSAADLQRACAAFAARPGPLLVDDDAGVSVFVDADQLAAHLHERLGDPRAEPLRALLLDDAGPLLPVVELAICAGRLAVASVGRFHATFLRCLALRGAADGVVAWREIAAGFAADRQLQRKLAWHRDRVLALVRELHPRVEPGFAAAVAFLRQFEPFRTTLARLDRDSPALLGLLVPLRPLPARERALALRVVGLFGDGTPLRRLAREANPGGRLSGAAVVIDVLLPGPGRQPRWSEQPPAEAAQLTSVIERFAATPALRPLLATLLFADDRLRLEAVIRACAGELPDVDRERDALAALRRLDETARRAAAVVSDLERCTGRRAGGLGALRLGSFVDQLRQQGGPVDALRQLAADVDALPAEGPVSWLRALGQWLVGVFAARLLKGVERDQVVLADWQGLAAIGAEIGRQSDTAIAQATAIGAERLVELLRHRRACLANQLDDVREAHHALRDLGAWVEALEPLVAELQQAQALLATRGVALAQALAGYLPELDAIAGHRALLRRLPEQLDELGAQLPRPGPEGLVVWLEVLRRRGEATRRDRVRMALEDQLGMPLPMSLSAVADDVAAVEAAWAPVESSERPALRAALAAADFDDGAQIVRAIAAWVDKRAQIAAWSDPQHPALAALDVRVAARCEACDVAPDEVRALSRTRARCLAAVRDLASCLPARAAADVVDAAALPGDAAAIAGDPGETWSAIAVRARTLYDRLTSARERYAAVAGCYPSLAEAAERVDEVVVAVEAQLELRRRELDAAVAGLHTLAGALLDCGERGASIPPEITLIAATRLLERDRQRLHDAVGRRHAAMTADLRRRGLPEALAPEPDADVLAWHASVACANERLSGLHATLDAADALGLPRDAEAAGAGWEGLASALSAQVDAGRAALHALHQRHALLARRCRRLGGQLESAALLGSTLAVARDRVAAAERELDAVRTARLAGASAEARKLYRAVATGEAGRLAAPVAELVALGLLCTAEAEA